MPTRRKKKQVNYDNYDDKDYEDLLDSVSADSLALDHSAALPTAEEMEKEPQE